MVPLVAFLGGMVVEGRVNARASLMASGKPGGRSSGRPESTSAGRVENLGAADNFWPAMAATVLVEEAREEAAVQAGVGRHVLPVFCRVLSVEVPSKSYWDRREGANRRHRCPRWMSLDFALEIAGG